MTAHLPGHFAHLLEPDPCARVAITLLHFLWQGVVVAGVVGVACATLRRASASARHTVLLAALGVMAACPVVTFVVVGKSDARPAPVRTAQAPVDAASARPVASELVPEPQAAPAFGAGAAGVQITSPAPEGPAPHVTTRHLDPERLR